MKIRKIITRYMHVFAANHYRNYVKSWHTVARMPNNLDIIENYSNVAVNVSVFVCG